jgi:hypothetical protein
MKELEYPIALLAQVVDKSDEWYLENFGTYFSGLLGAKDDIIVPIRTFLHGSQKLIYDQASVLLQTHRNNLAHLPPGSAKTVQEILDDPNAFRGNRIQQLKTAAAELKTTLNARLTKGRVEALSVIENRLLELKTNERYVRTSAEVRKQIETQIEIWKQRINTEDQIALIASGTVTFEEIAYPQLIDMIFSSNFEAKTDPQVKEAEPDGTPIRKTVSIRSIRVQASTTILQTEDDVMGYVNAYRDELLNAVRSGKRVTL